MDFNAGLSINDWAIPIHLFAGRPYTDRNDRWVTQIVVTFLCFYIAITWPTEVKREMS